MCLIIDYKPQFPISKATMRNFFASNTDGWGYAWAENGVLRVLRGFGFRRLWKAYRRLEATPFYLHLRMATHGHTNTDNLHPFDVVPGIVMMHNGVMGSMVERNKAQSDTAAFVARYAHPLLAAARDPADFMRSEGFRDAMLRLSGAGQRLVFIDVHGAVEIGDKWHTIDASDRVGCVGMRVSNTYAWGDYGYAKYGAWSRDRWDDELAECRLPSAPRSGAVNMTAHAKPAIVTPPAPRIVTPNPINIGYATPARDYAPSQWDDDDYTPAWTGYDVKELHEIVASLQADGRNGIDRLVQDEPDRAADVIEYLL